MALLVIAGQASCFLGINLLQRTHAKSGNLFYQAGPDCPTLLLVSRLAPHCRAADGIW